MQPRVLINTNAAIGDVRYWVFSPRNEEGREDLWWAAAEVFEEGTAFVLGDEFWVMEWGNHADYVCTGLVGTGALYDPDCDLPPTPSADATDDQPC